MMGRDSYESRLMQGALRMRGPVPNELAKGQDVCAITVTYHPDEKFPTRCERILREACALGIWEIHLRIVGIEEFWPLCAPVQTNRAIRTDENPKNHRCR